MTKDTLTPEHTIHIGSKPSIESAQIIDSFILIRREDSSLTIYQADESVISPRPLNLPENAGQADAVSLFEDQPAQIPFFTGSAPEAGPSRAQNQGGPSAPTATEDDEEAVDYADEADDLYNKTDSVGPSKDSARHRLPLFRGVGAEDRKSQRSRSFVAMSSKDGHLKIFSLPEKQLVFENLSLRYLPQTLCTSSERAEPLPPLEDSEIEHLSLFQLGFERPTPALAVSCCRLGVVSIGTDLFPPNRFCSPTALWQFTKVSGTLPPLQISSSQLNLPWLSASSKSPVVTWTSIGLLHIQGKCAKCRRHPDIQACS